MGVVNVARGSIFDSDCEALVCPVNCVGVMGAGLAKAFAERWPALREGYTGACNLGEIKIGKVWEWTDCRVVVACLPTKTHWRKPSELDFVRRGLASLFDWALEYDVNSLAIPALGCGLGGLQWSDVRTLIEEAASGFPFRVEMYGPE